jgi:hypothetical protein
VWRKARPVTRARVCVCGSERALAVLGQVYFAPAGTTLKVKTEDGLLLWIAACNSNVFAGEQAAKKQKVELAELVAA